MLQKVRYDPGNVVQGFLAYTAHVRMQTCDNLTGWETKRRAERENDWPEYNNTALLLSKAGYFAENGVG